MDRKSIFSTPHKEGLERLAKFPQAFTTNQQVHICATIEQEGVRTQMGTSSQKGVMQQDSHQRSTIPRRTQVSKTYENLGFYGSIQCLKGGGDDEDDKSGDNHRG